GGTPLLLKNLTVKVYMGLAQFTAQTDDNGVATVTVAQGQQGNVCLTLDNSTLTVIDMFTAREVCVGTLAPTSSPMTVTIATTDKYANLLAAITDANDYLTTVMGMDMGKVSVLTGWESSVDTFFHDRTAFTPCLGRLPNLVLDTIIPGLSDIAEFFAGFDIIM